MNRQNLTPEQQEKRRRRAMYKRALAEEVYEENRVQPPLRYQGRSKDFSIIPDEIIYSGDHLSHGEVRLWLAIFAHNKISNPAHRVSWPGRDRLAAILGIHPRRVSHFLEGLRSKGLLLVKRRMGLTSLYILKDPPRSWLSDMKGKLLSGRTQESKKGN